MSMNDDLRAEILIWLIRYRADMRTMQRDAEKRPQERTHWQIKDQSIRDIEKTIEKVKKVSNDI